MRVYFENDFWSCQVNSVRRAVQSAMLKPEILLWKPDFREGVVFGRRERCFTPPGDPKVTPQ